LSVPALAVRSDEVDAALLGFEAPFGVPARAAAGRRRRTTS
jgi:hypothetical protein